jgi:alpha-tubulin suppressor-like RCC1 family protein
VKQIGCGKKKAKYILTYIGEYHSLVLDNDGLIYGCGIATKGRIGI